MRVIGSGHLLFAIGFAGLGVLSLFSGDFAYVWQPVPMWVPWREGLAHISGILLLVLGLGMLIERIAGNCALAMTAYLASWVVLLQFPRVVKAPGDVGTWLGLAENLISMSGGLILAGALSTPAFMTRLKFVTGSAGTRTAQYVIGASFLVLGLSHFVYAEGTAGMVPAWLPDRLGYAYLTGACHFAAGLGILFSVLPRLAATLEAIMISLFVLMVHMPGAAQQPASRMQWTMLLIASAYAGAMWAAAKSYARVHWSWAREPAQAPMPNTPYEISE